MVEGAVDGEMIERQYDSKGCHTGDGTNGGFFAGPEDKTQTTVIDTNYKKGDFNYILGRIS